VVKRLWQTVQRLRRLTTSPSSPTRESITWVSCALQKGHFIFSEK
jgi:hypothetical protein